MGLLASLKANKQIGRAWLVPLCLVVVAVAGWVGYTTSLSAGIAASMVANDRRLQLFDRTLEANIERFHYLPSTISQSAEVREALLDPSSTDERDEANGFLSRLTGAAGADELYIIDVNGRTVAASNWWSHVSFVGRDYGERPYFEEAMLDGAAKYYAVGQTTQVPGYFLAERIDGPNGPLGVAVVKINLGEIEAVWWRSGELIAIVDLNQVVILSTRPDWRYHPLLSLDPASYRRIAGDTARYGATTVDDTGIVAALEPWSGTQRARIDSPDAEINGDFLVQQLRLPTHGWMLMSFSALTPLLRAAWASAATVALATAALLLGLALFAQRQRLIKARLLDHDKLEERVAQRTFELRSANLQLESEIAERQEAEKQRRDAQEGLVQAAKLASLGQALAGVAHEISQPVAALTTHIASAKLLNARASTSEVGSILRTMDGVLSRLATLTGHLKTFSRKETDIAIISDLVQIVHNALELCDHKLKAFDIEVAFAAPTEPLYVLGNPIHLEQVLINLISNAADAMEDAPVRVLRVTATASETSVTLALADTGTGIDPALLGTLFDPFVTTKEPGRGLGLGLSISYGLVRDIKGGLTVTSTVGQGSTFTITLPLTSQRQGQSHREYA